MRRVLISVAAAALLLAAVAPLSAQSQKGRLRILRHGQPIGAETYEITATATEMQARGQLEIQAEGATVPQTATAVQLLAADLSPRQYELRMDGPEKTWRRLDFSGGKATARYPLPDGKEDEQTFDFEGGRVTVLQLYHDFLLLARRYDFARGGPQTVRVFVPQYLQPGEVTLELKGVETQTVDGESQPVRELAITTPDSQLQLWVTESGRLVRLAAPLEGIEILPEAK